MPGTVRVTSDYDIDPDTLWAVTKDLDSLVEMNAKMVKMEGLPSGDIYTGQDVTCTVSLFGLLPPQPYRVVLDEVNDEERFFRSTEHGSGVDSWKHEARVEATPNGSRLTDVIEIEAGWKTPLVVFWANRLYRARHKPRLALLEKRAATG